MALNKLISLLDQKDDLLANFIHYLKSKNIDGATFLVRPEIDQLGMIMMYLNEAHNLNVLADRFSSVVMLFDYGTTNAKTIVEYLGTWVVYERFLEEPATLYDNYFHSISKAIDYIINPF